MMVYYTSNVKKIVHCSDVQIVQMALLQIT